MALLLVEFKLLPGCQKADKIAEARTESEHARLRLEGASQNDGGLEGLPGAAVPVLRATVPDPGCTTPSGGVIEIIGLMGTIGTKDINAGATSTREHVRARLAERIANRPPPSLSPASRGPARRARTTRRRADPRVDRAPRPRGSAPSSSRMWAGNRDSEF
jgi:hypothetical protein